MTDDTAITDRLRKLAEPVDDDMAVETIVLDESDLMETTEFERMTDPAGKQVKRQDDVDENSDNVDDKWTWIA